jgi:hypothetical protein
VRSSGESRFAVRAVIHHALVFRLFSVFERLEVLLPAEKASQSRLNPSTSAALESTRSITLTIVARSIAVRVFCSSLPLRVFADQISLYIFAPSITLKIFANSISLYFFDS